MDLKSVLARTTSTAVSSKVGIEVIWVFVPQVTNIESALSSHVNFLRFDVQQQGVGPMSFFMRKLAFTACLNGSELNVQDIYHVVLRFLVRTSKPWDAYNISSQFTSRLTCVVKSIIKEGFHDLIDQKLRQLNYVCPGG